MNMRLRIIYSKMSKWIVALLILSSVLWILFSRMPNKDSILHPYTLITGRQIHDAARVGYAWMTDERLLSFDSANHPFVYDIKARSEIYSSNWPSGLRASSLSGQWPFLVNGKWLVEYVADFSATTGVSSFCRVANLGESNVTITRIDGLVSSCYWMPKGNAWIEIPASNRTRPSIVEAPQLDRREIGTSMHVGFPVGFMEDYLFLYATNDIPYSDKDGKVFFPREIEMRYWRLKDRSAVETTKRIAINGNEISFAMVSPSGSRIIWQCHSKSGFPRLLLKAQFPFLALEWTYCSKLFVSSSAAEDFQLLGTIKGLPARMIQWSPSGNYISFLHDNKMYLIDIGKE